MKLPTAILLCGPPGCGKSTLAQMFKEDGYFELNRDAIRFSFVDPRGDWTTYQFNSKNESTVQEVWNVTLNLYIKFRFNIVVSDTLCKRKDRNKLKNKFMKFGYDVIVVTINPSLQDLLKWDASRGNMSVGEEVVKMKKEQTDENF